MQHRQIMSQSLHGSRLHTFLSNFSKKIVSEVIKSVVLVRDFIITIASLLLGAVLFIFEFEKVKMIAGFVFPFLLVYLVGEFLTILPFFAVIALMLIPKRVTMVVLPLLVVYSFFSVVLI